MPEKMRQQAVVARAPKRLAERFHQLRTGHCRTGQYLEWTKNSDTAACGWCQHKTQTQEHLLKHCKKWKMQQKTLWAEVRKARPLHGPGPDGRRAMHQSSPRLPTHHEGGKQGGTARSTT